MGGRAGSHRFFLARHPSAAHIPPGRAENFPYFCAKLCRCAKLDVNCLYSFAVAPLTGSVD